MPTVLTLGVSCFISANTWSIGIASEVPVMMPSGASGFWTSLAATGSVTAEKTSGIFGAAAAAESAEGVAIATIMSLPSPANFWQIELRFDWSPCAFW